MSRTTTHIRGLRCACKIMEPCRSFRFAVAWPFDRVSHGSVAHPPPAHNLYTLRCRSAAPVHDRQPIGALRLTHHASLSTRPLGHSRSSSCFFRVRVRVSFDRTYVTFAVCDVPHGDCAPQRAFAVRTCHTMCACYHRCRCSCCCCCFRVASALRLTQQTTPISAFPTELQKRSLTFRGFGYVRAPSLLCVCVFPFFFFFFRPPESSRTTRCARTPSGTLRSSPSSGSDCRTRCNTMT